ncbi:MAG: aminopeptidase [Termitinemataceae bacterium]|nr:MAG: aminopeptidase [Termitinemataceae bacterium]
MMNFNFIKYLPVVLSVVILIVFSLLFPCCYTLKQGGTMIGYLNSAVMLESILEKENASDEDKIFVDNIHDIRNFAASLGLKKTKNYTKYVEIDRNYLAAVVSASSKYAFDRHLWHFPVVGAVPYKGFFNVEDAKKEAAKLKAKNLDVYIRGVSAFSTLGFFRDPLYSYMKAYSVKELADLIIHESMHATVFLRGNMGFNEELAEIIGSEGANIYMQERFGGASKELRDIADAEEDSKTFIATVQDLIEKLQSVYAKTDISSEEKLSLKEKTINDFKKEFAATYKNKFKTDNYIHYSDAEINNANLDLYRLYYKKDSELKELYKECGSNLKKFIEAAKTIKGTRDPVGQMRKALS